MVGYANEATEDAEIEIHALHQDYFLKGTSLSLVQGANQITLPTDIYCQKIRDIIYSNGPKIYPMKRIRDPYEFYKKEETDYFATGQTEYSYLLRNDTPSVQSVIEISPAAQESGAFLKFWYWRSATRVPLIGEIVSAVVTTRAIQLAKVMDIPEGASFIIQFMKVRCLEKLKDFTALEEAKQILIDRKKMLVESLTERVPDNQDEIPLDLQFYMEHN